MRDLESILHGDWQRIVARKSHVCCECGARIIKGEACFARASIVAPGPLASPFYDEWCCQSCDWRVEESR